MLYFAYPPASIKSINDHWWGESLAADEVWKLVLGMRAEEAQRVHVVSLVAYIDDSFRDDIYVLAGHISRVDAWAELSKQWEELLPTTVRNNHDRFEFKMNQMMQTAERIERIQPFMRLIERYTLVSVSVMVRPSDIERALSRISLNGRRIDWGDMCKPFPAAYRYLMDAIHFRRDDLMWVPEGPIDFVFDEQAEKGPLLEAWDMYVARNPEVKKRLLGSSPAFKDSEKFIPVQAADLWAWWVRRNIERGTEDQIGLCDFGSWQGNPSHPRIHLRKDEDDFVREFAGMLRQLLPNEPVFVRPKAG